MNVHPKAFQEFLEQISFEDHGDEFERTYGRFLLENFPNSEKFWRHFVVPITKRMEGYPNKPSKNIDLRNNIAPEIEDIANSHYSMYINLMYAHIHLDTKMVSSLEDIYVHLGSVCDLVETVLEKWYLLLLKCQQKHSMVLENLKLEDFLIIAEDWYNENYPTIYDHYLSKGKSPPIRLLSRKNILAEYLGSDSEIRKAYERQANLIRCFRNVIVHDIKIGRISEEMGKQLIPRPKEIHKYRSWQNITVALRDNKIIARDFVEQFKQAEYDIFVLEQVVNNIWEKLIVEFSEEFNQPDRIFLRNLFDITFSPVIKINDHSSANRNQDKNSPVLPSGIYNGGTAIFRSEDDNK